MNKELIYQIALTQISGIGDVLAKNLVSYCGGVEAVFHQKRANLLRIPGIGGKLADAVLSFNDFSAAEKEVTFIEKHQIKPLFYLDKDYPNRLKQFPESPVMLYYLGNADLNNTKIVGIVGTRKASEYGKNFVDELCVELAETGCLVVSGLAYGIDIQAHRAALKNNLPTVGVMAHGLDRIYPAQHTATAKKMIEQGGLLTEFSSGTSPDATNFPKRNRIVAALCDVVIVVETALKGGAMITAELANYFNKEVMTLPGRTNDLHSQGCNWLIKQNKAAIITQPRDVFEWMNWDVSATKKTAQQELPLNLSADETAIVNYLRSNARAGIDDLAFALQLDAGLLAFTLLDMEFKGIVRQLPGKYFELI